MFQRFHGRKRTGSRTGIDHLKNILRSKDFKIYEGVAQGSKASKSKVAEDMKNNIKSKAIYWTTVTEEALKRGYTSSFNVYAYPGDALEEVLSAIAQTKLEVGKFGSEGVSVSFEEGGDGVVADYNRDGRSYDDLLRDSSA